MATAMKKCKVCGNEYEYCHTIKKVAGVFRWQDVACSPEHGSIYLARIMASRYGVQSIPDDTNTIKTFVDTDIDDDDRDELFEEDFDEEDDDSTI